MTKPLISLVVAVAQNGIIGNDGDMPWRLSTDLKRFKAVTMGKPVIMGRKTFESIGRPLPGRLNVVISRTIHESTGVMWATSLNSALEAASKWADENGVKEICIIGGGQIYQSALPLATRLYVTHVLAEPKGDTSFPDISDADWAPTSTENVPAGGEDTVETIYVVYERKN